MGSRGRWVAAAIGGLIAVVAVMALFNVSQVTPVASSPGATRVAVKLADPSPTNPLNREATAMRDLAPLFLPTERNATLERMPRREVGKTFFDVETTKLTLTEAELRFDQDLPSPVTLNGRAVAEAKPVDALIPGALSPPATGFGRSEAALRPLPARGGYLEVVATGTGTVVMTHELLVDMKPVTEKPWQPLQFLASVNPAGLVGPLILTERSGVEEVDQHFRNYLAQTYRIGDRLRPGIYRITIGP